jgi:hypothetical protein
MEDIKDMHQFLMNHLLFSMMIKIMVDQFEIHVYTYPMNDKDDK